MTWLYVVLVCVIVVSLEMFISSILTKKMEVQKTLSNNDRIKYVMKHRLEIIWVEFEMATLKPPARRIKDDESS